MARNVIVFGGTRGVGLAIVQQLIAAGDAVTVMIRADSDPTELEATGANIVSGDAFDPASIDAIFAGASYDTIINTLGNRPGAERKVDWDGTRNVTDAALKAEFSGRYVLITAIGCADTWEALGPRAQQFLGATLALKTQAEYHLRQSGLDYTIIRPGGLKNEPATGTGKLFEHTLVSGMIHREDVAALSIQALNDPGASHGTYCALDENQMEATSIDGPNSAGSTSSRTVA